MTYRRVTPISFAIYAVALISLALIAILLTFYFDIRKNHSESVIPASGQKARTITINSKTYLRLGPILNPIARLDGFVTNGSVSFFIPGEGWVFPDFDSTDYP